MSVCSGAYLLVKNWATMGHRGYGLRHDVSGCPGSETRGDAEQEYHDSGECSRRWDTKMTDF
jgi:hypothetical protein